MIDPEPLWLTLKLALPVTFILLVIAIPIGWWLSGNKNLFKTIIEVLVSLPLVLPPSVIGFYLLMAFSPANGLGAWLEKHFDIRLVFSFPGLLLASLLYSLPFMVHPVQSGFAALPPALAEASLSLGKTRWQTLLRVLLPNIKPALLTGTVLTFAHTVGEFGVVLMIGGNIPGKTRLASIAVYNEVEALHYHNANIYAAILLGLSFVILFVMYACNNRAKRLNII